MPLICLKISSTVFTEELWTWNKLHSVSESHGRADHESKAVKFSSWSMFIYCHEVTKIMRWWIKALEKSFLCRMSGLSLRNWAKSSESSCSTSKGVSWCGLAIWLGCLLVKVFKACSTERRSCSRPRTWWRVLLSLLGWGCFSVPPSKGWMRWLTHHEKFTAQHYFLLEIPV